MKLSKKKTELLLSLDINNKSYFDHFCEFWLTIYKHQVNECKIEDNKEALSEIMLNLLKNGMDNYQPLMLETTFYQCSI